MKKRENRDIELLYEVGCLRFINRTWMQFLGPHFANLAEHHLRVVWIALILAKQEGVDNTDEILKMALIHDLPESRTGDVNYLQRQYVVRKDEMAMQDIFNNTSVKNELLSLWEKYERKDTIEAQIVKDADMLDVDMELKEQEALGRQKEKMWDIMRNYVAEHKLYTKSAKEMWKEIQASSPHEWHEKARNRFTSGDWKDKVA